MIGFSENFTTLSFFLIFEIFSFLILLNGIRYFKYNKIIIFSGDIHKDHYSYYAKYCVIIGVFTSSIFIILLFSKLIMWGILISLFWSLFLISFFVWFWHTKEDPFHFEQKVWQDPRDKN